MKTIRTKTDLAWLMAQADTQQADSMQTVLLIGPPGSCKTMVARRMAARVPEPEGYDAIEAAWFRYGAGLDATNVSPFRAPHHTCSSAALIGGNSFVSARLNPPCEPHERIRPGEASLAHRGTLFLDELPKFTRSAVRDLAACLEREGPTLNGTKLPARPRMLVTAATPCPCGYHGTSSRQRSTWRCTCSASAIEAHQARLREYAEMLGIAVYVRLDLDEDAKAKLSEYAT